MDCGGGTGPSTTRGGSVSLQVRFSLKTGKIGDFHPKQCCEQAGRRGQAPAVPSGGERCVSSQTGWKNSSCLPRSAPEPASPSRDVQCQGFGWLIPAAHSIRAPRQGLCQLSPSAPSSVLGHVLLLLSLPAFAHYPFPLPLHHRQLFDCLDQQLPPPCPEPCATAWRQLCGQGETKRGAWADTRLQNLMVRKTTLSLQQDFSRVRTPQFTGFSKNLFFVLLSTTLLPSNIIKYSVLSSLRAWHGPTGEANWLGRTKPAQTSASR